WGGIEITRDITAMKMREDEIGKLNDDLRAMNRELEAFNYSLSHDLRNPLMGIMGSCQELLDRRGERGLDAEGAHLVEGIIACGSRIDELITAMLTLARASGGEVRVEDVDLSALLEEVAVELQFAHHMVLPDLVIEPGMRASGDRGLLRIALCNLLENAWKFSSRVEHPRIEAGTVVVGGEVTYYVRDNGVGFDGSESFSLFEPFRRLHTYSEYPGTGIGLATVQRVIRRHGGRIWAESSRGRGATFYFTLGRPEPLSRQG
ncbi:MAG TPA: ATP-binding protein, partial [Verrucomicrobiae bacterium]|nr:ATP-binding protein [Verrucomicrobiae bacterium]